VIRRRSLKFMKYLFLTVAALISVFPLYWMFVSATNTSMDVLGGKLLPGKNLITNFKMLSARANVAQAMWNSLRNSIVATVSSLIIGSIAGYGFEIYHDRGKDLLMSFLLLSMMIPFAAIMIPLFMMIGKLNLLNTTTAFVLPTLSTAFIIFLFRQSARFFQQEIIEAARIDGLSELGIFVRMYIPVMRSTYATAGIITFMAAWNNYLWPLIILQSPKSQTMPLVLSKLVAGYVTDYGLLMLAVSLSVLPIIVIFLILQKNFAEGVVALVK